MNLLSELNCYGTCFTLSAPFIALLVVISIALLSASLMLRRPKQKLITFVSSQAVVFLSVALTFYLMDCSYMLTLYLYLGYAITSTVLIFGVLRYYDRIMVRRLDAKPMGSIMKWAQEFVDNLVQVQAKLYYFDSAIPRAFASGKSIFVSIGLLELLNDEELKAVLAHEAWHIFNNSQTPYPKQLAFMTFSSSESEFENMADRFAAEIAGRGALTSARSKVDKVFI